MILTPKTRADRVASEEERPDNCGWTEAEGQEAPSGDVLLKVQHKYTTEV